MFVNIRQTQYLIKHNNQLPPFRRKNAPFSFHGAYTLKNINQQPLMSETPLPARQ